MKNLMAKCMDPRNPDSMVEHRVTAEIDGRPFYLSIYATDPMHAIQRAQETPPHLWRLDVPEVNHA
jgi:hypothetical protein